ncbi:MAG: winged helix-turn-helix domain-containing protein [Vicinamibacterales bacterium]
MTARNTETVRFGPFRFIPGDGLWREGGGNPPGLPTEVPLPPRALGVLTTLLAQPGLVVSKQELMDAVWPDAFVTESSLLEAVGVLRTALGDDRRRPTYIQTVHRRGYRFIGIKGEGEKEIGTNFFVAVGTDRKGRSETRSGFFSGPEWRPIYAACIASVLATFGMAAIFAIFGQHPISPRAGRFSISLPTDAPVDPLRGSVAVSPDGSRLVYVAGSQLFLRTVDRDEPAPIAGSEGASGPFFSPDGAWIGFFSHGSLHKIPAAGGLPIVLCAARAGAGAAWDTDGTIVFGGGPGGGLARVSAASGDPVVLASPAAGSREIRYGWPDILPGNRGILYTAISVAGSDLAVLDPRTGARTTIASDAAFGRYSPTGHVVFERQGRLEAAPFSLAGLALIDTSRPIVSGVSRAGVLDGPRFAFSRTGALVYVPRASDEDDAPQHWLDARGELRPNGLEIAFAYSKVGPFNMFIKPVYGQDEAEALITSPWNQFPTSWAPDDRHLAFTEVQPLTGADIWVLDVDTRQRRPLVRTLFDETGARFSPDGRRITYMSNESGRWEIYTREVDGEQPPLRISRAGGVWPHWAPDGRVVYVNPNGPPRRELRVVLDWFADLTRLMQAG